MFFPPGPETARRADPVANGGFAIQIPTFDSLPSVPIRCDDNAMCRMLIQAQSNIICSVFLSAFSLRSIKLITVLGFGFGKGEEGREGEGRGEGAGDNGILRVWNHSRYLL